MREITGTTQLSNPVEEHANSVLSRLLEQFGEDLVKTDAISLQSYGKDWTSAYQPDPLAVVLPRNNDQVVSLVKLANEIDFALVPSGGRTGLSGGAVARNREVVVAFDRMNQILDFNPQTIYGPSPRRLSPGVSGQPPELLCVCAFTGR